MSNLNQLPTHMIPGLWPALLPFLERACRSNPLETPRNLLQKALSGKAAVCIESDNGTILTVFVLEVHQYPERDVCLVAALAGRPGFMSRLQAISNWVDQWARLHGCAGIAIMGRPGWARVFKQPGVEHTKLVMAYRSLNDVSIDARTDGHDSTEDRADARPRRRIAALPASSGRTS